MGRPRSWRSTSSLGHGHRLGAAQSLGGDEYVDGGQGVGHEELVAGFGGLLGGPQVALPTGQQRLAGSAQGEHLWGAAVAGSGQAGQPQQ